MEYPPPRFLLFFLVVTTMPTTAAAVALAVGVRLRRHIIIITAAVVITAGIRVRRGIAAVIRIVRIRRACGIAAADISASVAANVLRIAKQRIQPATAKVAAATRITGILRRTRITYIAHNFLRPSCVFEKALILQYMISACRLVTAGAGFFLLIPIQSFPKASGSNRKVRG